MGRKKYKVHGRRTFLLDVISVTFLKDSIFFFLIFFDILLTEQK